MPTAFDLAQREPKPQPTAERRPTAGLDRPPQPEPIQGLIFDVADVFYDATLWRRWLWRLVSRLGVRASYTAFYQPWDQRYLPDVCSGRRELAEALQAFLLAAGLSWAQVDEIEASSRVERNNLESGARPLPGIVPTVLKLQALGLRMAAWCDAPCPSARLEDQLRQLGLDGRFAAVVSSFDLESVQPAPACYRAALRALALPARRVAYVGHDAQHLAGAKAVGLTTVAFNYQRHAVADHYLSRFEDLPRLLRGGQCASTPKEAQRSGASERPLTPTAATK